MKLIEKTGFTFLLLITSSTLFAVQFPNYECISEEYILIENPFPPVSEFANYEILLIELLGQDEGPPVDPLEPDPSVLLGSAFIPFTLCILLYLNYKMRKWKKRKMEK